MEVGDLIKIKVGRYKGKYAKVVKDNHFEVVCDVFNKRGVRRVRLPIYSITMLTHHNEHIDIKEEEKGGGMNQKIFEAKLKRKDGSLLIYVKVAREIEELFKRIASGQSKKSKIWGVNISDTHEFYLLPEKNDKQTNEIFKLLEPYANNYGADYIVNERINVALLRTKGLSEGKWFKMDDYYSADTIIEGLKDLKKVVAILYKNFISEIQVEASLTITDVL
ncbi:MAG: hypothetical protein ACTSYG_08540 [Candidatus Heimdallarchaeota archaeon]